MLVSLIYFQADNIRNAYNQYTMPNKTTNLRFCWRLLINKNPDKYYSLVSTDHLNLNP